MPKFEFRDATVADNFHMTATVGSLSQFEMAMAIAFNDRNAVWYADTKAFGLVFFSFLTDQEKSNLNRPVKYPLSQVPSEPIEYEDYIIKTLPNKMSVGPALEFALDWLKGLSQDQFEWYAGPPAFHWDVWSDVGVKVSTGTIWNQVGSHPGGICYVKPNWMYVGK